MTGENLLEKLLESFESSYDIERTCEIDGDFYDAHASFNATSAKYVLIKKAELWRADCFEHVFFRILGEFSEKDIRDFQRKITEYIEPQLVRGGKKYPEKNHMYTYMTAIFIAEEGVPEAVRKQMKKFRYMKNYLCTIRGYSEARILVFDLKEQKIYGSPAARELVKGYTKANIF